LTGAPEDGAEDGAADGVLAEGAGTERDGTDGTDALVAAALCPVSVIPSAIPIPAAASTPAPAMVPDRKLVSSIRASTVLLSLPNPVHPLSYDIARYMAASR
jgi:hypothetical protein